MKQHKLQGKVASAKSQIVAGLPRACQDERAAVEFMEAQRWGAEPRCPHCGMTDVYQMRDRATGERNRRYLWRCRECKEQYTVRIGTVFEDSPIPLKHWCYAFWAACASKKGVSALQIKRMTGISYKSTLFMMHRIRYAMADNSGEPLTGTVEADETYVGGRPRYHGLVNKGRMGRGTRKAPVVAIVQRGGGVRAMAVANVSPANLRSVLCQNVAASARLVTDEFPPYKGIGPYFAKHDTIKHNSGKYVDGDVYTNTVESFFALLKRGVTGTYHAVSKKHLHRYVAEFSFRWDTRKVDDGARTQLAIKGAEGKRLLYREPTAIRGLTN